MARIILALMLSAGAEALGVATLPPLPPAKCSNVGSPTFYAPVSDASCTGDSQACSGGLGVCARGTNDDWVPASTVATHFCVCCLDAGSNLILPDTWGLNEFSLPACPDR